MSIHRTPHGKWKVRWVPPGGRERSRTFIRKVDADRFQASVIAAKDADRAIVEPMWRRMLRLQLDERAEICTDSINPQGSFVYLLWSGSDDRPIYVGISNNVLGRLGSHMNDEAKRQRVARVTLIRCYSIEDARALELRLIRFYNPELNVRDNLNGECHCGNPRLGTVLYCSDACRPTAQKLKGKDRSRLLDVGVKPGPLAEISAAHRRAVQKLAAQQ